MVNIISWIAVSALASGTVALSVLLAVFSGLEVLNKNLYKKLDPDVKIEPKKGKYFSNAYPLVGKIKKIKGIVAVSQTIEQKVYLRYRNYDHLAYLKGIDSAYDKVMSFNKAFLIGNPNFPYSKEALWVGLGVAQRLSLVLEDYKNPLHVLAPKPGKGLINKNALFQKKSIATGVFHLLEDIDENYVYSSLEFAQNLIDKKGYVSSLEVKVHPNYSLDRIKEVLSKLLGGKLTVKTRQDQQKALFKMINIENFILYLLLCLILIITSFTLIGAIGILIVDKKKQIQILSSLGMSSKEIKDVFFYVGALITLSGWFIGIFIGYGMAFCQRKFSWIKANQTIALPVEFSLWNFVLIGFTVWTIGLTGAYCYSRRLVI